jgi:hypothetical protein
VCRTDRDAQPEFLLSCRRTAEQQIGDVRACHEQHEADGARQHEQRRLDLADDHLRHEGAVRADPFIFPVFRLKLFGDGGQVGAHLFDGDAGFETSETNQAGMILASEARRIGEPAER